MAFQWVRTSKLVPTSFFQKFHREISKLTFCLHRGLSQNGVFRFQQTSNAKTHPDSSSGGAWQFLCTSKHVITSIFPKSTREFSSQSTYYGGKLNANFISIFLPHPIQIPPATSRFLAIEGLISQPGNKERPFFDHSVLEGGGARYRFA